MKCTDHNKALAQIKEIERAELIAAVKAHGGEYVFPEEMQPCVLVEDDYGSENYNILSVSVDDSDWVSLQAQHSENGDIYTISLSEVEAGHTQYITLNIAETDEVKDVTDAYPRETFPVITLSREDFEYACLDASGLTNDEIESIAWEMADWMGDDQFSDVLHQVAKLHNVPDLKEPEDLSY